MKKTGVLSKRHQDDCLDVVGKLCQIFWGPKREDCRKMRSGKYFESFEALTGIGEAYAETLDQIHSTVTRFEDEGLLYHHLEEAFVQLFVSTQGKIIPLYQSCYEYEDAPMMGSSAIRMKKRLQSEGLEITPELQEPPDHLSIELEYLYYLLENGWSGRKKGLLNTADAFISEELLPWVSDLNCRLQKEAGADFYLPVSLLLILLLKWIAVNLFPLFCKCGQES